MNNIKPVIIFLIFILSSCTQTFQNNGLSEKKLKDFDIKIGETSKKYLMDNYGPPIFENLFNDNVIYYISHGTSYKTFDERKTEKLLVLEIVLDDKNIVKQIKNYSEKDSLEIKISKDQNDKDINFVSIWKDIINGLRRRTTID